MLKLTFLGTGAACPTIDRNVSGLALAREGERGRAPDSLCRRGHERRLALKPASHDVLPE